MNITCKAFKSILFMGCLIFTVKQAGAQAKNAIGIGAALNTSRENSQGFGALLQGEIKITKSVSVVPSIGGEVTYGAYAGLGARYYLNPAIYFTAGSFAHYSGDDAGGIGGTGGIGFMLLSSHRQTIDINLHGDYMENNHRATPIAGIRLIYSFSFTRLD
jgi:hypothetical protein